MFHVESLVHVRMQLCIYLLDLSHSHISCQPSDLMDYLLLRASFDISFPAGSKRQNYDVLTIDDISPENTEYFNADVNARPEDASRVLIGSPKQPLIEILDNDDCELINSTNTLLHKCT